MAYPTIQLLASIGAGIIIECDSGVVYSNQTGGYSCRHSEMEGVFVPIARTRGMDPAISFKRNLELKPNELISPETDLIPLFTGPKYECRGANCGIDSEDADLIDAILEKYKFGRCIKVDRSRLEESHEAWIWVSILSDDTGTVGLFEGFAPYPRSGILTWRNSD